MPHEKPLPHYYKREYKAACNIPHCKKRATIVVYGYYGFSIGDHPLGKYCGKHANAQIKELEK